jgi:hypothetical protein
MPIISFSPSQKAVELIVYICYRLKEKSNYGSTLLGKILYFIDSMSYLKLGKPITTFKYIKQEFGPTPMPAMFLPIRNGLVDSGDLEKIASEYFGRTQVKFIAKRVANIEVFEKNELVIINEVIDQISDHNATQISDYTHQFLAWILANNKEELPNYTFLLTNKDPDNSDVDWAKKSIKEYESSIKNASQ